MSDEILERLEQVRYQLQLLAQDYYATSAAHGFHATDNVDSFIALLSLEQRESVYNEMQDTKRLMLIAGEFFEAFEELRAGHAPTETYYTLTRPYEYPVEEGMIESLPPGHAVTQAFVLAKTETDPEGTVGLFKPEGVPSELADGLIRVLDYCHTRGIDLGAAMHEKAAFNLTRPWKHGRKF